MHNGNVHLKWQSRQLAARSHLGGYSRERRNPCITPASIGGGSGGGGSTRSRPTVEDGDGGYHRRGWGRLGAAAAILLAAHQGAELLETPSWRRDTAESLVSVIVPALNEEKQIAQCVRNVLHLDPSVHEVIVVDGHSLDRTAELATGAGAKVVRAGRGRARQMNAGAAAATGDILVFLHADSVPPRNLVQAVRRALAEGRMVLGGFRTIIRAEDGRPLAFMTAHQLVKTYYIPALLRPLSFLRGAKLLFGDQTLFCRAADFARVGGYDGALPIMEDADLGIRLHSAGPAPLTAQGSPMGGAQEAHPVQPAAAGPAPPPLVQAVAKTLAGARQWARRRGRVTMVLHPPAQTSGRRLQAWGNPHATLIHIVIGFSWYFGATPDQMRSLYARMYTDNYR